MTFNWTGDLDDDCTAELYGLTLRVEKIDEGCWWWAIYAGLAEEVVSSHDFGKPNTGEDARHAAEKAFQLLADERIFAPKETLHFHVNHQGC